MNELDELETSDASSPAVVLDESATAVGRRPRRGFDRGLFIASFVIACGLVLIIWGMTSAMTGNDGINRPDEIESVQPVENALQVLQQERIVVDLAPGFQGRLEIDGIALPTEIIGQTVVDPGAQPAPGAQVDLPTTAIYDPGNNIVSFQPVDGALVETLTPGLHEARIVFWDLKDGPDAARSYRWKFTVI